MSARHKLNQGFIQGCLVLAGLAGAASGSWALFWIVAIILVGLSLLSGDVRLTANRRGPHRSASDRSRHHRSADRQP